MDRYFSGLARTKGKNETSIFKRLIKINKIVLMMIDIILIGLSYLISFYLSFENYKISAVYFERFKSTIIFVSLVFVLILMLFGLYRSLWKLASIDEYIMSVCACLTANIIIDVSMTASKMGVPIRTRLLFGVISTYLIVTFRISFRIYRKITLFINKKVNFYEKRLLVIGAGDAGALIVKEIRKNDKYKIVGLIDDDIRKAYTTISGIKVLGDRHDIIKIVEEKSIDEIIIAIPSVDSSEIANICKQTKCIVKILPDFEEVIDGNIGLNNLRDLNTNDLLKREPVVLDNIGIKNYIKDKVILITGGGGSIGSEICRQISRFSPKLVLILDIYENNAYDLQNELRYKFPNLNLKVLIGSVRDRDRIDNILKKYKVDVIFHAAAHKHVPLMEDNPSEAIKNNVLGTLNLVECASKYNVKKFVLISTDKAVNPTNIMGASKRICELIVQSIDKISSTEFVAVRFGNVLGSNGSVIPLFQKQISNGGPITITDKNIIRYFMTIEEASKLVLQAGAFAKGGEIFVLDMGKPVKIYDLACDLIRLSGLEPNKDIDIEITGLRPGEKLYEELLMDEEGLMNTEHNKIFIGKPMDIDYFILKKNILNLEKYLKNNDDEELIGFVKHLVPTFKEADEVNEVVVGVH